MASRRDYYYRELVTEAELDAGFEGLEGADRALVVDLGVVGVYYGLGVAQAASPNLTVAVAGGGAYDQEGQRCRVPSEQSVNVAVDSNNTTTAVSGVGNERYVSVFLVFDRALSDQRTDGNSDTVWFQRDESFKFTVVQGAEALVGAATRPALLASGVLLADVRLVHSQTQVLDASISTTRRQWAFLVSGAPQSLARGRVVDVFTDLLTYYNNHVTGVADVHPAGAVAYGGGGAWADGTTNPAATVEVQFDKVITDLGSGSGTAKIRGAALSGTASTIAAGTLFAQLGGLKLASNVEYGGGGAWLDGTTNPATSVEAQFDKVIADLVGQGASTSGGHKVGIGARTTWLGGRTNPATTVFAAVDKVITDLAATASGDDGAERIGYSSGGALTATNVSGALSELAAEKADLAGATFTGIVGRVGTTAYLLRRIHSFILNPLSDSTVGSDDDTYYVGAVSGDRVYTVSNPTYPGQVIRFIRLSATGGFTVTFRRADASTIGRMLSTGKSWIEMEAVSDNAEDPGAWSPSGWGGDVDSLTF